MKPLMYSRLAIFVFSIVVLFSSCKKSATQEDLSPGVRKDILTDIADNVIIKNYEILVRKSDSLIIAVDTFTANPNQQNLLSVRAAWKNTDLGWKACEQFGFGPGETTAMLNTQIGTWPINPTLISTEIATNSVLGDDFVTNTGTTRKGMYAIEYLIYGNDTTVMANFSIDAKASVRQKYLQLLAADIKSGTNAVYQDWVNIYRPVFISADGLDSGSSLGIFLNSIIANLEIIINLQLGNPIGKKNSTDNGTLRPTQVEAVYSNESIALSLASIDALTAAITADNAGLTGKGVDYYIEYLKINDTDGKPLQEKIITQLDTFRAAVAAIPPPLQTAVTTDKASIDNAWKEGKRLLVLLKNDLPVNIGIQITFNSNDGD